mmetsp:Transcript_23080/g.54548  ORF Transcript_23080/g.54548 Transcript_23080/m.54548 type:complete len:204 (+) Transcript_23080:1186-1797(+)
MNTCELKWQSVLHKACSMGQRIVKKFLKNVDHLVREIHSNDARFRSGTFKLGVSKHQIPHSSEYIPQGSDLQEFAHVAHHDLPACSIGCRACLHKARVQNHLLFLAQVVVHDVSNESVFPEELEFVFEVFRQTHRGRSGIVVVGTNKGQDEFRIVYEGAAQKSSLFVRLFVTNAFQFFFDLFEELIDFFGIFFDVLDHPVHLF